MKYVQEFNVDNFPFWGPAVAIVDEIKHAKKMDELQEIIETAFYDDVPSKTDINDFVWNESDFIFKQLGMHKNDTYKDTNADVE